MENEKLSYQERLQRIIDLEKESKRYEESLSQTNRIVYDKEQELAAMAQKVRGAENDLIDTEGERDGYKAQGDKLRGNINELEQKIRGLENQLHQERNAHSSL